MADPLETILYCCPKITPATFCKMQPCVDIALGPARFTLTQPASSAIVYLLGLIYLAAAVHIWRNRKGQASRAWWSAAMALACAASVSAGTSYQAFGYMLKCAGRPFCLWTSWWEVAYLVIQVASMNAMIIALAYATTRGKWRCILIAYAIANSAAHLAMTIAGAAMPVKFMISFEMLILFSVPNLIIFLLLCGRRYQKHRSLMDRNLLIAGLWLILTTSVYYAYFTLNITQKLWSRGLWFSENDVLHIFMIAWVVYVGKTVVGTVKDMHV